MMMMIMIVIHREEVGTVAVACLLAGERSQFTIHNSIPSMALAGRQDYIKKEVRDHKHSMYSKYKYISEMHFQGALPCF